jgi:two-component system sensor histidine kinase/response regulator
MPPGPERAASSAPESRSAPPGGRDGLPELPGIDVEDALRLLRGKVGLYRRLLDDFRADYADFEPRFREALERGDQETAVRAAHSLKGVAGNVGSEPLRAAALGLETALREGAPQDQVEGALGAVLGVLGQVLQALGALDGGRGPARDAVPEPDEGEEAVRGLALELRDLLRQSDTSALEAAARLRERVAPGGDGVAAEALRGLGRAVEHFEFDEALDWLERSGLLPGK